MAVHRVEVPVLSTKSPRRGTGKRCVVYGCSNVSRDNISLHSFPTEQPGVFYQWVAFVQMKRKDWVPTAFSHVCSVHFSQECFPLKYRIMSSMGQNIRRKTINKDAVPTIQADPLIPESLTLSTSPNINLYSTRTSRNGRKRPSSAFVKTEYQRHFVNGSPSKVFPDPISAHLTDTVTGQRKSKRRKVLAETFSVPNSGEHSYAYQVPEAPQNDKICQTLLSLPANDCETKNLDVLALVAENQNLATELAKVIQERDALLHEKFQREEEARGKEMYCTEPQQFTDCTEPQPEQFQIDVVKEEPDGVEEFDSTESQQSEMHLIKVPETDSTKLEQLKVHIKEEPVEDTPDGTEPLSEQWQLMDIKVEQIEESDSTEPLSEQWQMHDIKVEQIEEIDGTEPDSEQFQMHIKEEQIEESDNIEPDSEQY